MIKDRVVQAAVVLVIEPIFEADFEDWSYGFRPGRSAHQALERIATELKAGKTEVYDADLEGYFDSIPHDKLMKCVRMRVAAPIHERRFRSGCLCTARRSAGR